MAEGNRVAPFRKVQFFIGDVLSRSLDIFGKNNEKWVLKDDVHEKTAFTLVIRIKTAFGKQILLFARRQ